MPRAGSQPEHLRQPPRQRRAQERVETLLDAAAEVFGEVGYEGATMQMVVDRAEVSPGTLYRWFPDKSSLAVALSHRYLDVLATLYTSLLDDDLTETVAQLIRRVLSELALALEKNHGMAVLLAHTAPAGSGASAERLGDQLGRHLGELLDARVPGIEPTDRDRIAKILLRVSLLAVETSTLDQDRLTLEEYGHMLVAYVDARFPAAASPVWSDPSPAVPPLLAAPQVPLDGGDAGG